jgi:hypothetical protein
MADPLSITASAVGIIVPALHGTRLLLEDLQQLKDAPKTVKRLVECGLCRHGTQIAPRCGGERIELTWRRHS